MSSHHFVKEDQEPAVLIADASAIPFAVVEQLLEWSPTVVVLEQALDSVIAWGIKLDVVVGHLQHEEELREKVNDQAPVKILNHQPGDDPLATAIYFLRAGRYRAVNVIGASPSDLVTFIEGMDVVCFYELKRWTFARTGIFEKWYARGHSLLISINRFSSTGLTDDLVTAQDGLVKIEASLPFWIGEDYS